MSEMPHAKFSCAFITHFLALQVMGQSQGQWPVQQQPPQQRPGDYPQGDYGADGYNDYPEYYGETTVNDAASFLKRQGEMTTMPLSVGLAVTPVPAAPPLPPAQGGGGEKPPRRRKGGGGGRRPGPRRQRKPVNLRPGNNPLSPPLRFAVAQAPPLRRAPQRRRKQDNADHSLANQQNGTTVNGTHSDFISLKVDVKRKKVKKNGKKKNLRRKNKKKGKGNKRNKNKNARNTTVAGQFEYQRPPNKGRSSPFPGGAGERPLGPQPGWQPTLTPSPEEYYYEYYDEPARPGANRFPTSGGRPPFDPNVPWSAPPNTWQPAPWSPAPGWSTPPPGAFSPTMGQPLSTSEAQKTDATNFCQAQNFNDATYCCSSSPMVMFDPDDMDECLEDLDTDEEPGSVEEFTINRGVLGKGNIDFSAPAMQKLTDAICLTQCTMIAQELLGSSPGSLNFQAINSYITTNLNENNQMEWAPTMNNAARTCERFITEKMGSIAEKVETSEATCYTKPYLYIQCIKQYALMECPKPSDKASGDLCRESMNNMNQCNPFD